MLQPGSRGYSGEVHWNEWGRSWWPCYAERETAGEAAWSQVESISPRRRPDAVIAANDLLAFGVMRGAASAGRRVPRQLAVVGIDDTQFARVFSPSLSSVSLGARTRGRIAARLLLDRIAAPGIPFRTELVTPQLVVRESSAPLVSLAPSRTSLASSRRRTS